MKQVEIAKKTGLSCSHISRVFSGQRTPSVKVLIKISKAMKISAKRLMEVLGLYG